MDWQAYLLLGAAAAAVVPVGLLLAWVHRGFEELPEDQHAIEQPPGPS